MENLPNSANKNVALLVVGVGSFAIPFAGSSLNIALPSIGKEFSLDAVSLNWLATAFILAAAVFLVPLGKLADIYGIKKVYATGMITFMLASLFASLSCSSAMLMSFLLLEGLGGAMLFSTGAAILTSVFPPSERGKSLGFSAASVYIGISVGPALGGFLTQNFGWRSVFIIGVIPAAIASFLIFWKLKGEWAGAKGEKFDLIGSFIYGGTIVATMFGFSHLQGIDRIFVVLGGICGLITFVIWEMKVSNPVFDVRLLITNKVFAWSNLTALINYSATFGTGFLLSLYLQHVQGLEPQDAGLIMVCQPIVMAIFSPFAGRFSDKIEPRIMASFGMALVVIGLTFFIFLTDETSLIYIIIGLSILGLGFAFFSSPNTNAIMSSVEKKLYAVAASVVSTMRVMGQMLSMGIVMLLLSINMGNAKITPEYFPAFLTTLKTAFMIFAILCFFGIFSSLARGKVRC